MFAQAGARDDLLAGLKNVGTLTFHVGTRRHWHCPQQLPTTTDGPRLDAPFPTVIFAIIGSKLSR
jgi:hypothetical protein